MPNYDELYDHKYFLASRKFQKEKKRLLELVELIKSYNPTSVLDVGCGLGELVKALLAEKLDVYGVDRAYVLKERMWNSDRFFYADAKQLPFPNRKFDLVVSSDFFEHLPEKDIIPVLLEMRRVVKLNGVILARVAYEDKLTARQALYHCTNRPKKWWEKKLEGVVLI